MSVDWTLPVASAPAEAPDPSPGVNGSLAGKRFCITGGLSVPREEMSALLEAKGATVTTAVSGLTDYLVVGDEPGLVKLNAAMEQGTLFLTEDEIWQLLGRERPEVAYSLVLKPYQPRLWPARADLPLDEVVFSVVDVETSGSWRQGQRVAEVAIVQVSGAGEVVDEYSTLVNPEGPVTFTRIHGLTAHTLKDAPLFAEVAGDIAARLKGNVFVAHNVSFDHGAIKSEFNRLGHSLPLYSNLCTVRLARKYRMHPHRRANLAACCDYLGIEMEHHHAALSDTRAAAQILLRCLAEARLSGSETLGQLGCDLPASPSDWPDFSENGRVQLRRGVELRS